MNYFDLHCDTVTSMCDGNESTAITLKKAAEFENYSQLFSIWLSDSCDKSRAVEKAEEYYAYFEDFKRQFENSKTKPLLSLENAISLGDDLKSIDLWKKRGVRSVTLTWNGENALGRGASFQSGGLTEFGKAVFQELQEKEIAVDVSHLNKDGFLDCLRLAKVPIIATHSNCFSICPHRRNLEDFQIKEIFSLGGIVGVCYFPLFLGNGDIFELIYEHIYHMLELGGENGACLGSDFDGAKMDKKLNSLEKVKSLKSFLSKKGFSEAVLEKVFFGNAENFFNNVLH